MTAVTQKDVASAVGVSVTTVSYVLTGSGSVSAQTRRRVLAAARKLGYTPNRTAQAMRTGRSGCLGLVVRDLIQAPWPDVIQCLDRAARARSYLLILVDIAGDGRHRDALALLRQQGVDGVIWGLDQRPDLAPAQLPMVLLGRAFSGFDAVQSRSSRESSGPQYAQVADEAVTLLCDRIADPARAPRSVTLAPEA